MSYSTQKTTKRIMEQLDMVIRQHLNELSHETIKSAANKLTKKYTGLIGYKDNSDEMVLNKERALEFINKIDNPQEKRRWMKLYKEDKLLDYLVRKTHVIRTHAHGGLEWFRDNTDISLSPQFFDYAADASNKSYKNTSRKPTKDEADFYKYFSSLGTDTEGIPEDRQKYFKDAIERFYKAIYDIDLSL